MHTRDDVCQTRELTYMIGHANGRLHLWKFATWRFVCRWLTVFVLPWENYLGKLWYELCQRMFFLCSLLGVLRCHILYLSIQAVLSLFLCMVWGYVLTSLICIRLSNFKNTTCLRDCLFPAVYSCLLCRRLIDDKCVGLFLGSLFHWSIYLFLCQ